MQRRSAIGKRVLCVSVLAAALVAGAAAEAAAEKVTVMMLGSLSKGLGEAVDAFSAQTGIQVEFVEFATWFELMEKLPTMVAGGIAPDVVYHDNSSQADLYHKGIVQPVEEYVKRDGFDLSRWPEPLLEGYRYGGVLYSLPTGISNWVTFYNVDKMRAAGLPGVPADWDADGFTFSDLLDMARKLTRDQDGDGTPEQYGISGFFSSGMQGLHLWGLDWIDDDQTEFVGTTAAHIEAIGEMRQLWEFGAAGGNWLSGTAVMLITQPYYLNTIATAMDQGGLFTWAIGVLPRAACRCNPASFHSLGMVAGSANPEGAWAFIKFMTTDPAAAVVFSRAENRTPVVPASILDFNDRWERKNPGMNAHVFTSGFEQIVSPNWFGLPRAVFDRIVAGLTQVMRGQQDPRVAMEEIKPVVDGMLQEMRRSQAR